MEVIRTALGQYQQQMTWVFLSCLILGAVAVIIHPALPLFFVLLYFFVGLSSTKEQKNSERFADSLYYLGFLLTLISLWHATQADKASEAIIENLGTGLSTTLFGLALRVLVLQFRETVSDQEEEAQIRLQNEIDQLVASFSGLREGVRGFHEEFLNESNNLAHGIHKITEAVEVSAKTIAEIPEGLATTLAPAMVTLANKINAVSVPENLIALKTDEAFHSFKNSLDTLAKDIDVAGQSAAQELSRTTTLLREQLQSVGATASKTRDDLTTWSSDIGTIPSYVKESIQESVSSLRSRLRSVNFDAINSRQEALVAQLEITTQAFSKAASTASQLTDSVSAARQAAEHLERTSSQSASNLEAIGRVAEQVKGISSLPTQFNDQIKGLSTIADVIRDSVIATSKQLPELTKALAAVDTSDIKSTNRELANSLTSTTEALAKAKSGIDTLTNSLAQMQTRLQNTAPHLVAPARAFAHTVNLSPSTPTPSAALQPGTSRISTGSEGSQTTAISSPATTLVKVPPTTETPDPHAGGFLNKVGSLFRRK